MMRPLETHINWTSDDVADPRMWTVELTPQDHRELDAALAQAKSVSGNLLDIGREHFPLDGLARKLEDVARELIDGRGFTRIAALDHARYGDDDLTMLYWGIGLHLGDPWPQNAKGHVMGDVTDQGKKLSDPTFRGNELGQVALDYHTDGADVIGLMCLRKAKSGGLSCVANAVAIYNALVATRPDLAEILFAPQPYDLRGEQAPGAKPFYTFPVFTEHDGRFFIRFIPRLYPRLATPRRGAAPDAARARGAGHGERDGTGPALQRLHGPCARRDAVHQQLSRPARTHVLRGRRRPQAAPQAAVAGDARADEPACAFPQERRPPLGQEPLGEQATSGGAGLNHRPTVMARDCGPPSWVRDEVASEAPRSSCGILVGITWVARIRGP